MPTGKGRSLLCNIIHLCTYVGSSVNGYYIRTYISTSPKMVLFVLRM